MTRSAHQQSSLHDPLKALGADVVAIPLIEQQPMHGAKQADIYRDLNAYDWVVFTSVNAIEFFMKGWAHYGTPELSKRTFKIACVGPMTAQRLSRYQLTADLLPTTFVAEGLIETFASMAMDGKRVLLPRAETARDVLPDALSAQGAIVDAVATYRTKARILSEKDISKLNVNHLDAVTFTSSSTVHALEKWIDEKEQARFKNEIFAFCIGPMTSKTAHHYGYKHVITAGTYTVEGLIESLTDRLSALV